MAIKKIGTLRQDVNAHYKELHNTNIMFYNMDINTSTLKFIITRNKKTLPLGKNNVDTYIHLEAEDGSFIQDDVVITDELNGICEYDIPKEFLNHTGKAKGQFYISVDNKEDTVTNIDFTFNIKDSLINTIPSNVKVNYIRKYDELEKTLKEKVQNIEDDYKAIDDYITKVRDASEEGVQNVNETKEIALTQINSVQDDNINQINTKGTQYVEELTGVRDGIQDKIDQFNTDVKADNYVKEEGTESWQKFKLTESNGTTPLIPNFDFNSPEAVLNYSAGTYYVRGALNSTTNNIASNYGYLSINTTYSTKSIATLTFIPMGTNTLNNTSIYMRKKNGDWGDWKEIGTLGAGINIETEEGSQFKSNKALEDAKEYVDISLKERHVTLFLGDARERNSIFSINESYKNFSYLLIKYRTSGGAKTLPIVVDEDKKIPIHDFNMTDTTADNPKLFEMGLIFNDDTEIEVTHNNTFDVKGSRNLYDDNNIVIKEIIGVR